MKIVTKGLCFFLVAVGSVFFLGAFHSGENAEVNPASPLNVLLITADDLGPQLGCYGDPKARTPNLDRLASRGMRFDNAYVTQASCSPSRSSILTGLYPHQNGQVGLANHGYSMHEDIVTLPQWLKKAGYYTGIIGKLHVNPESAFPFDYDSHKNARTTLHVRQVANWAEEFFGQASQKPFFLMVNYFDPHRTFFSQVDSIPSKPYTRSDVTAFSFQGIGDPAQLDSIAGYYNGAARVDEGVALLLEKLRQAGKAENTLVIFLGDHGPPFARGKISCYEAGLKIPLTLYWPGITQPNTHSDALVSTIDLVPSILEAARVSIPANLPGRSLSGLQGRKKTAWRQTLAAEFTAHGELAYPQRSIRDDRYKLIVNLLAGRSNPGIAIDRDIAYALSRKYSGEVRQIFDRLKNPPREELYDLKTDPDEFHNLADDPAHQAVLKRLQGQLREWQEATRDPLLDSEKVQALGREYDKTVKPKK